MTIDEMKNKISMELKSPVTQQGFEIICKENAELKAQISVLLSCKDCPENKGGYICEKEYNDKCLAQKIQYIKELEQESAECKKKLGNIQIYLAYKIPHELINEATNKIWKML